MNDDAGPETFRWFPELPRNPDGTPLFHPDKVSGFYEVFRRGTRLAAYFMAYHR